MPTSLPTWVTTLLISLLERFITPELIKQVKAMMLQWLQDEANKLGSPLASEVISILEKVLGLTP